MKTSVAVTSTMKKIKKRKRRVIELKVDFGEHRVLTGMNLGDDGMFTFYGEQGEVIHPSRIEVGSAYLKGGNKQKTLTRVLSNPLAIQIDPNRQLTKYAFLFAVDTNTKQIGAVRVSVSAVHYIRDIKIDGNHWSVNLAPQDAFEFHDSSFSPERIGWWEIIQRIKQSPDIKGNAGLIVDSDMNQLTDINARKQPVVDNIYLPDGIELLYGCGDRGTEEYIANAAIANCDRVSSQYLKRVEEEQCSGPYISIEGGQYTRYRYYRLATRRSG